MKNKCKVKINLKKYVFLPDKNTFVPSASFIRHKLNLEFAPGKSNVIFEKAGIKKGAAKQRHLSFYSYKLFTI